MKISRNMTSTFLTAFFLVLSAVLFPTKAMGTDPARVLYISSYHPGFSTFFRQIQGIKNAFAEHEILLDVEFMDSKRFSDRENEEQFKNMLAYKIKRTKPYDVIMTADDNALLFVLKYKRKLFPTQPVVFLGVNNIATAKDQNSRKEITGVIEAVSMKDTISMMIHLLPEVKQVVALVDATTSGQGDLDKFRKVSHQFSKLNFSELSLADHSFSEFALKLKKIDKNTAVLLLSSYVDKNGERLLFGDSLNLILDSLNTPLFHLWYHGLGDGVLGGKVISHEEQGRTAGEIVVRIIEGEDVEKIPVVEKSPNRYVVDYQILQKFGLEKQKIPADYTVLNRPYSFYSQYKYRIWSVVLFFIFQTVFIVFLMHVIRTKNHTESALRESEQRYYSLFADNHSIMLLIDPENSSVVDANPAACKFYGYGYGEFIGMKMSEIDVCSSDDSSTDTESTFFVKRGHGNYQHSLADGEVRDVETYSGPISLHGRQLSYSIIHDVTERRRAEDEKANLEIRLQQAQKMEAIGTLAGGISHDFNNILSVILGYSELARENVDKGSDLDEKLAKVIYAGQRAKDLIQQILTFSRQGQMERFPLQPANILKETLRMLRSTLPANIEIKTFVQEDCSLILSDPTQLNQIILNLCTNAFHAMEEYGGILDVSLREKVLSLEDLTHEPNIRPGTFIVLSVTDTGPGIPLEIRSKIFDPYYTTKTTGKGTGLGLSIVHGIIKSCGGFISLYSKLEQGTAFHVYFPAVQKEELPVIALNEDVQGGQERILFVDDEVMLADMGKEMLESYGYEVTIRTSSLDAYETFQNEPDKFDLVITDQTMPGMTGVELSVHLLNIRPDIPIILCSGYSNVVTEEKATSMGIKKFAKKPLTKRDLAKLARMVLD